MNYRYLRIVVRKLYRWCVRNITMILRYSIYVWILALVITQGADIAGLLPDGVYDYGNTIYGWIDGNIWLNGITSVVFVLLLIWIQKNRSIIEISESKCFLLILGLLSLNILPVWYPLDSIVGISYNLLITVAVIFFVAEYFYFRYQENRQDEENTEETPHPVFNLTTDEQSLADTGWQSYANSLVCMLPKKSIRKESMAIGIYGEWGSGKTTFLQHVCSELEPHYKVIEFNPWGCLSAESVITDFFNAMKQCLCHNSELASAIEDYLDILTTDEAPDWIKWITGKFLGSEDNTVASQKRKVEELLKDGGQPVAVLIDDIDRLEADEVFEVLRLIRITANFRNTVFIVAYDKKHVCEMLRAKGISSAVRYIEKIFNVEVSLPGLESKTVPNIIRDELYGMTELDDSQKREIEMALWQDKDNARREWLISSYIHNFREAKRFAAMLALSLNHLKKTGLGEFNLYDLFWLEVLHFCCNDDYEALAASPFGLLELTTNIISKESRGATYFRLKSSDEKKNPILNILFGSHRGSTSDHRRVCFINSYTKYFCYRMPSTIIPLVEFQVLMHSRASEKITAKINEWGGNMQYRQSLTQHLAQFNIYYSVEEYVVKNYITALIAAHPYIIKDEELRIYHRKFMSSCCREGVKRFLYDSLKAAIEKGTSADWNNILSSMIASQYYGAWDETDNEVYILEYEQIKLLMEFNMDMYLNKNGKPDIVQVSNKNAAFHKFLKAGSYVSMHYPENGTNAPEKTADYSNPLCDKLIALYKGDNATDFDKFIDSFINTDYENEIYEDIKIATLIEQLFSTKDNFIQFIKDSFVQTDEVRKFIDNEMR